MLGILWHVHICANFQLCSVYLASISFGNHMHLHLKISLCFPHAFTELCLKSPLGASDSRELPEDIALYCILIVLWLLFCSVTIFLHQDSDCCSVLDSQHETGLEANTIKNPVLHFYYNHIPINHIVI